MKLIRSGYRAAAMAALVLAGSGTAAARGDVTWSVGIHAAPGVTVGVGNARPVYAPVYVAPAPVFVPAPVYYAPPPVYYVRPAPVYYAPYGHVHKNKWKSKRKHWKHHG